MHGCRYTAKMSAYHDGVLSPSESSELEVHLRDCPECACALREMRQISDLIQCCSCVSLSNAALTRLYNRPRRSAQDDLLQVARFLTVFATVLLVVSLSLSMLPSFKPNSRPTAVEGWKEIAAARELDGDQLEEPETELTHWVVAGLSGRTAR
jgi:anti-sigma factor RsiW